MKINKSWIFFFAVIKVVTVVYLSYLTICLAPDRAIGKFAVASGDTFSYTGAMENYILEDKYYFFNGKRKVFAGRLPHYSVPYYLFRQLTNKENSHDLLVLYQLIWEVVASVLFLNLLVKITKNQYAWMIGLVLLLFSTNWTNFTYYISPESLSISFLVIFLYFYQKYLDNRRTIFLILAGLFLSFLTTHKAYFSLIYLFIGIELIIKYKMNYKSLLFNSALVSIPLIVILTPWVIRNQIKLQQFILLQENSTAGYNYTQSDFAFRKFVTAWGGDIIQWEKSSAGCYFIPSDNIECIFEFPDYVWTEKFGFKEVEEVRNEYVKLQENYTEQQDLIVAKKFELLTRQFKSEKSFRYYILSPMLLLKKFLMNSGSYFLPISSSNPCYNPIQLGIKWFQSLVYLLNITLGIIVLLILVIKKKMHWMYLAVVLLIIVLFPIGFRVVEWRFMRTIQPILFIPLIYVCIGILGRAKFILNLR